MMTFAYCRTCYLLYGWPQSSEIRENKEVLFFSIFYVYNMHYVQTRCIWTYMHYGQLHMGSVSYASFIILSLLLRGGHKEMSSILADQ